MSLYKDLGLSPTPPPTIDEIKKAFKQEARKHHPDKGGNEEKFKRLVKAYKILVDSDLRAKYDLSLTNGADDDGSFDYQEVSGSSNNSSSGGGGVDNGSYFDEFKGEEFYEYILKIFAKRLTNLLVSSISKHFYSSSSSSSSTSFYNNGSINNSEDKSYTKLPSQSKSKSQPRFKPRQEERTLEITLEDIYHQRSKILKIIRPLICRACSADGTSLDEDNNLSNHANNPTCKICQDKKYTLVDTIVNIPLSNQLDAKTSQLISPYETDELKIHLLEKPHLQYKRYSLITNNPQHSQDLFLEWKISLAESLGCLSRPLQYLDGKEYIINCDHVVTHLETLVLPQFGLPRIDKNNNKRGNLYIRFHVDYKKRVDPQFKKGLIQDLQNFNNLNPNNHNNLKIKFLERI